MKLSKSVMKAMLDAYYTSTLPVDAVAALMFNAALEAMKAEGNARSGEAQDYGGRWMASAPARKPRLTTDFKVLIIREDQT